MVAIKDVLGNLTNDTSSDEVFLAIKQPVIRLPPPSSEFFIFVSLQPFGNIEKPTCRDRFYYGNSISRVSKIVLCDREKQGEGFFP